MIRIAILATFVLLALPIAAQARSATPNERSAFTRFMTRERAIDGHSTDRLSSFYVATEHLSNSEPDTYAAFHDVFTEGHQQISQIIIMVKVGTDRFWRQWLTGGGKNFGCPGLNDRRVRRELHLGPCREDQERREAVTREHRESEEHSKWEMAIKGACAAQNAEVATRDESEVVERVGPSGETEYECWRSGPPLGESGTSEGEYIWVSSPPASA
jgi:hypothetical protein